jgi:hypothetical protein|tara:strand:+ start:640 stop:840 length:201 start_codon:yes stop_codon:yes gene_type:complete
MIVLPENRKAYLKSKPMAYQSGWFACESGVAHQKLNVPASVNELYTQGYGDCFANTECLSNGEKTA